MSGRPLDWTKVKTDTFVLSDEGVDDLSTLSDLLLGLGSQLGGSERDETLEAGSSFHLVSRSRKGDVSHLDLEQALAQLEETGRGQTVAIQGDVLKVKPSKTVSQSDSM